MQKAKLSIRLSNYLIDTVLIGFIINLMIILPFYDFHNSSISLSLTIRRIILISLLIIYYIVCEYVLGQTLGKYLTNSKVLNVNNEKPIFSSIVIRSLVRFIPFEPLTFLSPSHRGWHDIFSKTKVVSIIQKHR